MKAGRGLVNQPLDSVTEPARFETDIRCSVYPYSCGAEEVGYNHWKPPSAIVIFPAKISTVLYLAASATRFSLRTYPRSCIRLFLLRESHAIAWSPS
jgi:hypothetical protein